MVAGRIPAFNPPRDGPAKRRDSPQKEAPRTRRSAAQWFTTGGVSGSGGGTGHRLARRRRDLVGLVLSGRQRDQTAALEIAATAAGRVGGVLRDEFLQARRDADLGLLHVDEERARQRVGAVGDRRGGRGDAIDGGALHLVAVFVEEREAEHADRARGAGQGLDDGVVVLAGVDPAVAAQRVDQALEALLVVRAHFVEDRILAGPGFDAEFEEGVTGAGRG